MSWEKNSSHKLTVWWRRAEQNFLVRLVAWLRIGSAICLEQIDNVQPLVDYMQVLFNNENHTAILRKTDKSFELYTATEAG